MNLDKIVSELKAERRRLDRAIGALEALSRSRVRGPAFSSPRRRVRVTTTTNLRSPLPVLKAEAARGDDASPQAARSSCVPKLVPVQPKAGIAQRATVVAFPSNLTR